jgi:predicted transcriptional regulator
MPPVTAIKAPPSRKARFAPSRRKIARASRAAVDDAIPASFLQGLKDIAAGRVVEMEKALHEPYLG